MLAVSAQLSDLLLWYNAVFVTIFGIGLFFTLLQLIGLGGEAHVDADADMDADLDGDVDADADADVDAHVDADGDADVDHDTDVAAHGGIGIGSATAQLFGLGKVPLSISLMVLCYTVGVAGWISNAVLATRIAEPAKFFPFSLLIALVAGFVLLRAVSTTMARYVPSFSTTALDPRQLVGSMAQAVLPISDRIGQATLHDKWGTLHTVQCRTAEGAEPIVKGQKVVLVRWLPDRNQYVVGRAK